jgi:hypothetical protein
VILGDGMNPAIPADRPGADHGRHRLSIVLPAYNEEANILEAISRATEVTERLCADHEIIVVDDGSADGTVGIVRGAAEGDPRIRLVRHARNLGYGEALHTGFRSARFELVLYTDSDNQFDLNELEGFLPWIERANVVAGYRIKRRDPFVRLVTALMWNQLVRMLFRVSVRDIDCAFKLFRRSVFDEIDLESVGAMVNTSSSSSSNVREPASSSWGFITSHAKPVWHEEFTPESWEGPCTSWRRCTGASTASTRSRERSDHLRHRGSGDHLVLLALDTRSRDERPGRRDRGWDRRRNCGAAPPAVGYRGGVARNGTGARWPRRQLRGGEHAAGMLLPSRVSA